MPQPSPAKDWCFTINNPSDGHWEKLFQWDYKYLVFQLELGESGTPHMQGFIQFQEKIRLTGLKKLCKHAHWEKRKGTVEEAVHYCKKPVPDCECKHCAGLQRFDAFHEDGECSFSGERTELSQVADAIKAKGITHAVDRFPHLYIKFHSGMKALATHYTPGRKEPPTVTVLYGKSGTGKTRYAMECFPRPYLLGAAGASSSADFVGDYRPLEHETFVLEEFYGDWKFRNLLRVLDRYPNEVQTKGGYQQFLASHVVITSNVPPDEWYPKLTVSGRTEPLHRRIHNLICFTEYGYVVKKGRSTQY